MAYFLHGYLLLLTLVFLLWLRLQMVYWLGMVKISILVFSLNMGPGAVNHFFSYKYYAGSKFLYNPHHVVYIPLCLIFVKFYKDEFYCKFFFIEMRWDEFMIFIFPATDPVCCIYYSAFVKQKFHSWDKFSLVNTYIFRCWIWFIGIWGFFICTHHKYRSVVSRWFFILFCVSVFFSF